MSRPEGMPPLRIAMLGDFDGLHTRRWAEAMAGRGHEVHAITYYAPRQALPGVTYHVLRPGTAAPSAGSGAAGASSGLRRHLPPGLLRLVHAARYSRAGLRATLRRIAPDVFHGHYVVEHGFYGAFAGFRPYVVSAWGSDLLVESHKPLGHLIARGTLRTADLVTANDASLAWRAAALGVRAERLAVIHLGIDALFLDAGEGSVNLHPASDEAPTLVSDRALEPLYNIDVIVRAFAALLRHRPAARLLIAGEGSERVHLEALARDLVPSGAVQFLGRQTPEALAATLAAAHVFVSVPSSDSMALSIVEAMAAGAFPVVSDLPSVDGWVQHGETGLRVPPRDADALSDALQRVLDDVALRRDAALRNRAQAAEHGLREANMARMERHYYRLAGYPVDGEGG